MLVHGKVDNTAAQNSQSRAPAYHALPPLGCAYYTYWSGIALGGFKGYFPDRRVILLLPTNDGMMCNFIEWPATEFDAVRHNLAGSVNRTMALLPRLAERAAIRSPVYGE